MKTREERKRISQRFERRSRDMKGRGGRFTPAKPPKKHGHSLEPVDVPCPCGGQCEPVEHPRRHYGCARCGRAVGCHPGSWAPMGVPANSYERRMRVEAHAYFDPLWGRWLPGARGIDRRYWYQWLARRLGIPVENCHIGMLTGATLLRAIEICRAECERRGIEPDRR